MSSKTTFSLWAEDQLSHWYVLLLMAESLWLQIMGHQAQVRPVQNWSLVISACWLLVWFLFDLLWISGLFLYARKVRLFKTPPLRPIRHISNETVHQRKGIWLWNHIRYFWRANYVFPAKVSVVGYYLMILIFLVEAGTFFLFKAMPTKEWPPRSGTFDGPKQ